MAEMQEGGRGDVWILSGDSDLKKFLRQRPNARIVRSQARKSNPRNSKVKDALAAEAIQHKKFEDFSSMYWDACSRGLYWYATDEKRFNIGLAEKKLIKQGRFYVHCSPTLALRGKNEKKKFVAELDLTKLNAKHIHIKRGSDGAEIRITGGADFIKVSRVLDAAKAKRAFKWQLSILPSSKEELRLFWKNAWDKHKKKIARIAVQQRKKAEREAARELRLAQKEREAEEREIAKAETAKKKAKRGRIARGRAAQKVKGTKARARAERQAAQDARVTGKSPAKKTTKKASKKAPKKAAKKKAAKKKKVVRRTRVPGPGVTGVTSNPGTRKVPATKNRPASK
jgi:hypothetical protein